MYYVLNYVFRDFEGVWILCAFKASFMFLFQEHSTVCIFGKALELT